MSLVISRLRNHWKASDFEATENEFVRNIPNILKDLGIMP